jgi:hypothetical protein
MASHDLDVLGALLEEAAALPTETRGAFVDKACHGDDELRDALASLLEAHDAAERSFEPLANRIIASALLAFAAEDADRSGDPRLETDAQLGAGQRFGHYEIGQALGSGGMSDVWAAKDLETGRHVALKALRSRLTTPDARDRFLQEGRLAARVTHPNIVYVFGTEEIEGVPVIAMELASGGTLKDLVTADGPLPTARAVDTILQVIAGLEAAAGAGILHRDVKPSNCFVDAEGRIQIGDFGIAAAMAVEQEITLRNTGTVRATPAFASPEQLCGAPLDERSDIYAVGATLHYLLTGRPPFDTANGARLIGRVLHERPAGVRAVRRDVPRPLDRIVQQCLAKDPAERPPSYAQLHTLLLPYSSASPAPAPPGQRMLAFAIDGMIVRVGGGVLPFLALAQWRQQVFTSVLEWVVFLAVHSLTGVAYFGVSEAVWSASPGKMLFGLRVIRTGGQPPGLGRSVARVLLWWLSVSPALLMWVALWPSELGAAAWSTGWPVYLAMTGVTLYGLGVLFSTARRRNGFAGLHDLATDTRVVSALQVDTAAARSSVESPPAVRPQLARLGPYVVLDETAAPGIVVGFDEQLARRVWIRHVPPGTPPVSSARRNVSRSTRLRWLTGSRDTNGGWDAYEAAPGAPFPSASQRPADWAVVRVWLHDLAQEITAGGDDGTSLPLTVQRIWVAGSRTKLLDWPVDSVETTGDPAESIHGSDVHRMQRVLHDVAMLGLHHRELDRERTAAALPLHAREFLDDLAAERFASAPAVLDQLRSMPAKPLTLTRGRRAAHLAICGAAPLISALVLVPALIVLLPLLAKSPDAILLDACLRRLTSLEDASTAEAAYERAAIETYVAGRFGPLLTAPTSKRPWFWPLIDMRKPAVERALVHQPSPSDQEVEHAARQLAGLLSAAERDRALAARGLLGWRLTLAVVLLLVAASAAVALTSAFVASGGAGFRMLSMAVVDQDGREVSRLRGLARALIAWSPGIAAFVWLLLIAEGGSLSEVSVERLAFSLVALAVFVAGAVWTLFTPRQGLQDRILRTSLVAR